MSLHKPHFGSHFVQHFAGSWQPPPPAAATPRRRPGRRGVDIDTYRARFNLVMTSTVRAEFIHIILRTRKYGYKMYVRRRVAFLLIMRKCVFHELILSCYFVGNLGKDCWKPNKFLFFTHAGLEVGLVK